MRGLQTAIGLALTLALTLAAFAFSSAHAATNDIFTVAGMGIEGPFGDGGPAIEAQLHSPYGVAATADGGFLIADWGNHRIRRVSPTGTIATVAGTTQGLFGDRLRATDAKLNGPAGVAATADGGFLIADRGNHRIRRVSPEGIITTVAGSTRGLSGDGGDATAAQLEHPVGVAATADGGFLIADGGNHRIRRVSPDGIITTVAGGTRGFSGDGGEATAARLDTPYSVATTADGGFLIADMFNSRVRRVSPDGIITTVAGTGIERTSGDGGPATEAELEHPAGVAATPDGGFLIVDFDGMRVRRVSPAGTITTVAGNSPGGFSGDGGPATAAQLSEPWGVAATADGDFLIADRGNNRIRFVDADLRPPADAPPADAPPADAPPADVPPADAPPATPGAEDPPAPQTPTGQPGSVPARFTLTLAARRIRARPGRLLTVRYRANGTASVTLAIVRNGRRIARVRGLAHPGRNRLGLRAPRRVGRYRLELTAITGDSRPVVDRARLTVRGRR